MFTPTVFAQVQDWNTAAPGCIVDGVPTLRCFEAVFSNLVFMSGTIIALVLFVMLFMGGFSYLTSLGNPEKMKKAQSTLMYAVIGFVLFLSTFVILKVIDYLFLGNCGKIFQLSLEANNDIAPCP